jgi:hypothetical protein
MPIRFGEGDIPLAFEVVQFLLNEPVFVIAGSDPALRKAHVLHYLSEQRRTVPCLHEDCPWHKLPIRQAYYLPALRYGAVTKSWKQCVLPLTWGMRGFQDEKVEGKVWEFSRTRCNNGPVRWRCREDLVKALPFAGFDVVPSLVRMWGMYTNFKRRADAVNLDTLKFPDADRSGEMGVAL